MAVLCAAHHSAQRCAHVDQGVQVGVPWIHEFGMSEASGESPVIEYVALAPVVSHEEPASVIEYVAPAPDVTCAAPAPVIEHVAPAPVVADTASALVIQCGAPVPADTCAAPAPVIEYVTLALVIEYIAPPPAVTFLRRVKSYLPETMATVTTDASSVTTGFVNP